MLVGAFKRFAAGTRGNFAVSIGAFAPVLLGIVGLSVDYSIYFSQRSAMHQAADQAVLAAVREAALQGWSERTAQSVVDDFVSTKLSDTSFASTVYSSTVTVDQKNNRVRVSIRQDGHGYLMLGYIKKNPQIEVTSEAALASAANICVLALNGSDSATLFASHASMTGNGCGFFSNSKDREAIRSHKGGMMRADTICSAGGYSGWTGNFDPNPVTDCPAVPDPLAERPPPSFTGCDYYDVQIKSDDRILHPGVYCGGLKTTGEASVRLKPGIYVIKDGELSIQGKTTLRGRNVGFYLTGKLSKTRIANSTRISLSAPESGPMAGILFFEDRNSPSGREFEISSKNARTLIGTIYLPRGYLTVKGKSDFASASEWTAIVAQGLRIENGPVVELNSDYQASDIPVPAGIAASSGTVYLTE